MLLVEKLLRGNALALDSAGYLLLATGKRARIGKDSAFYVIGYVDFILALDSAVGCVFDNAFFISPSSSLAA